MSIERIVTRLLFLLIISLSIFNLFCVNNVLVIDVDLSSNDNNSNNKHTKNGSFKQNTYSSNISSDSSKEVDNPVTYGTAGVVWLLSYPNSGTSFTMNMIQSDSNKTVATNYAKEVKYKPRLSLDVSSRSPPFILNNRLELPTKFILTKTHCGGYCNFCSTSSVEYRMATRYFTLFCAMGNNGKKYENMSQVKKSIHLLRDPINNIVSNFHLAIKSKKYPHLNFTNDKDGFREYCQFHNTHFYDRNSKAFKLGGNQDDTLLQDGRIEELKNDIPCYNQFYKYITWHNNANSMIKDLNIPTQNIWYEDYEIKYQETKAKIFQFMELDMVGDFRPFESGKHYSDYFTVNEKKSLSLMIERLSLPETWELMKRYHKNYSFNSR